MLQILNFKTEKMKNNLVKYYIVASYLCTTFVMSAQSDPGTDAIGGGTVETDGMTDVPGAPVGDYVWLLALVGLVFVYMKFKAMQKSEAKG